MRWRHHSSMLPVLLVLVLCVVIIAAGVALAPHLWAVGAFTLKTVLALGVVALVLGLLARWEERFARWYDTTRMARWLAGPPSVTLTVAGTDASRDPERVAETE